jgi:cytochrome c oxidase assembly factor CtaG
VVLPSPDAFDWSPLLVGTLVVTAVAVGRLQLAARADRAGTPARSEPAARPGSATTSASAVAERAMWLGAVPASDVAPADTAASPQAGAALGPGRIVAAAGGILLLAIAFLSPLATLAGHYLLTAHLVQVTLVMGFAPPLLLLGLPRQMPSPPRGLRVVGRVLVHPACAIVLVNLVFFGWHGPVLYDAALQHPPLYALQQVSLLLVSLQFWWAIVEPTGPGSWSMGGLLKLGYILLATIPQTFAGLLFALAHHTFYAPYAAAPRVTGLDALGDQQLAGALMAILSKLGLFAAFAVILWRVLDAEAGDDEQNDDGGHGRPDDRPSPGLPDSPAWLDLLRRGRTVPEPKPLRPAPGLAASPGRGPERASPPRPIPAPLAPASAPDRSPAAR